MGQKVHPTGFRLGVVKDHTSIWYAAGPAYVAKLHEDLRRSGVHQEEAGAGIC